MSRALAHPSAPRVTPSGARAHAAREQTQVTAEDLHELMQVVAETTQRLQATHVSLQNEVARLQRELAEANAALRRSQSLAALGEMAAGIAHEVRNPLGSIQLYIQMLAEDVRGRPQQSELCSKIERAVIGLDAIVKDVLSFARETRIDPQPICAHELMQRALAACDSLLHCEVTVLQQPETSSCCVHVDVGLMTQALANIIRNAVEAMAELPRERRELRLEITRRRVRCTTGRQETRVIFSVEDRGPGIPDEVRARMFNPFFTTRKTGTGLGLAIVHRIIDAHGGHIGIENVKPGGARFDVYVPPRPILIERKPARRGSISHIMEPKA